GFHPRRSGQAPRPAPRPRRCPVPAPCRPCGYPPSLHLLDGFDPQYAESVPDDLPDLDREEKPRLCQIGIVCQYDALCRVVVSEVPEGVEGRGELVEIE